MAGSIPPCVWSMGNLTVLQLSGNGLKGNIFPPRSVSPLLIVALSGNAITGTVPVEFQKWPFLYMDISNNKIRGEWTELPDFYLTNDSEISFSVNRISGRLPPEFKDLPKVDVLKGNTFECTEELPEHDPNIDSYVCGSEDLDLALDLIPASLGFTVIMLIFIFAYVSAWLYSTSISEIEEFSMNCTHIETLLIKSWDRLRQYYSKIEVLNNSIHLPQIPNLYGFFDFMRDIRYSTCVLTGVVLATCLTLYPSLRYYINDGEASTQTHAYNWSMSLVFLSGLGPIILVLSLWVVCAAIFTIQVIVCYRTQCSLHHHIKYKLDEEVVVTVDVVNMSWSVWLLRCLVAVTTVVFFIVIIVLANGVFVYIQFSDFSPGFKSAVQFLKGFVDHCWGVIVGKVLDLCEEDPVRKIVLGLAAVLFNDLVAPLLTTAVLEESCFRQVFFSVKSLKTSYNFVACLFFTYNTDTNTLSCANYGLTGPIDSSYTPVFIYNNRCSASLLTSYIPAFLYSYSMSAFVLPWFALVFPIFIKRMPKAIEIVFYPYVLWPKKDRGKYGVLFDAIYFMVNALEAVTL